jgi:hypothetical protein
MGTILMILLAVVVVAFWGIAEQIIAANPIDEYFIVPTPLSRNAMRSATLRRSSYVIPSLAVAW